MFKAKVIRKEEEGKWKEEGFTHFQCALILLAEFSLPVMVVVVALLDESRWEIDTYTTCAIVDIRQGGRVGYVPSNASSSSSS